MILVVKTRLFLFLLCDLLLRDLLLRTTSFFTTGHRYLLVSFYTNCSFTLGLVKKNIKNTLNVRNMTVLIAIMERLFPTTM